MIYFFPYLTVAVSFFGVYKMGSWVWAAALAAYLVIPLIEILTKDIKFNPAKYSSKWSDISLALTPIVLTAFLIFVFYQSRYVTTTGEFLGLGAAAGILLGAFGISAAHELVHRRQKFFRALGVWNLVLCNFAHWGVEHVFGHHKYVATPKDPATARKNEWLYTFWIRTYWGVLSGAWSISKQKVIGYWTGSLILSLGVYFIFGGMALAIWWIASIMAALILQTVDYIEHYGLLRSQNEEGHYTAFKAQHAWDTASFATNVNLFNLGLHSHHHMKAAVPFQELSEQPNSREMPFGYSVMFLMALVPFIYIPVMNKRIAN